MLFKEMIRQVFAGGRRFRLINIKIADQLEKLDKNQYTVIQDFEIKDYKNKKMIIDYIIISEYGIFVINVKRFKGLIYGYETDYLWHQNKNGNIEKFFNPFFQNQRRIDVLKIFLQDFKEIEYHNIVVFSDAAEFYIENVFQNHLIHVGELFSEIASIQKINISEEAKEEITKKLIYCIEDQRQKKDEYINVLIENNKKRLLDVMIKEIH
ncbi:MAG: NERD domain-containing protein [Clostridiales bacterium]|nr:NERD domain-containing protein [Clostridiales bacterium]